MKFDCDLAKKICNSMRIKFDPAITDVTINNRKISNVATIFRTGGNNMVLEIDNFSIKKGMEELVFESIKDEIMAMDFSFDYEIGDYLKDCIIFAIGAENHFEEFMDLMEITILELNGRLELDRVYGFEDELSNITLVQYYTALRIVLVAMESYLPKDFSYVYQNFDADNLSIRKFGIKDGHLAEYEAKITWEQINPIEDV